MYVVENYFLQLEVIKHERFVLICFLFTFRAHLSNSSFLILFIYFFFNSTVTVEYSKTFNYYSIQKNRILNLTRVSSSEVSPIIKWKAV